MSARALAIVAAVAAAVVTLAVWPKKARSPEDEIRALVARCVRAAEEKDLSTIVETMAPGFRGPSNASRDEVKQIIAYQVLRGGDGTTVFNPQLDVTLTSANTAEVSGKFVFARGKPKSLDRVPAGGVLSAYQIEARLEKLDSQWRFLSATYRPL